MSKNEKFNLDQINKIQNYVIEVGKNLKDLHLNILKYNEELGKENFAATYNLLIKLSLKINDLDKILKQNKEIKISGLDNEIVQINTWVKNQKDPDLLKKNKIEYKQFFKYNLDEKSKSKKLQVKGLFPKFECNNFKLKLNENNFSLALIYGGDEEKMKKFEDWDVENILNYISNFYKFFEKINLEDELKVIHESYENCLKNKSLDEESVPVIDILAEYIKIKEKIKDKLIYPKRILFSFLIYKISKNPNISVMGKRITKKTATRLASSKSEYHLWIPRNMEDQIGENIMYLSFKKVDAVQ